VKKIIHLSDLHVGHEQCGDNFRTIVDRIIYMQQPAENYVVLITGDLVDNANKSKQTIEVLGQLERLKEKGFTVLVIPGNHDYGTGTLGDEKFVEPFKEKFYNSHEITYPKLDIIDEVAFIGLDSTAEELHWRDRVLSEGELGKEQLARLNNIIIDPQIATLKKVVYMHHHPFDYKIGMELKDSADLKKIIENKIDALLFGHYHNNARSTRKKHNGSWGIPRCYNAGSSTHKNGDVGFQRVIDLSNEDLSVDYEANFI